jgi:hypothetical protein
LPKAVLVNEVEKLRRENAELKIEVMQTSRKLARFEKRGVAANAVVWQKWPAPWKTSGWRQVISRDPANWLAQAWEKKKSYLGSKDGVVQGPTGHYEDWHWSAVVNEVGQRFFARSCLLGDPIARVLRM